MTDPSEIQTWILSKLKQVDSRLDSLEANSHNAASSDQPIVGPPSLSEDSRALARPEILAEVKTILEEEIEAASHAAKSHSPEHRVYLRLKTILQRLTKLDHRAGRKRK